MTRWAPWLLLLLPFGSLLAALEIWRRHRQREQQPDLSARWKAFIGSPAADGEPGIPSANLPPVKPLRAVKKEPPHQLTRWEIEQINRAKVRQWNR